MKSFKQYISEAGIRHVARKAESTNKLADLAFQAATDKGAHNVLVNRLNKLLKTQQHNYAHPHIRVALNHITKGNYDEAGFALDKLGTFATLDVNRAEQRRGRRTYERAREVAQGRVRLPNKPTAEEIAKRETEVAKEAEDLAYDAKRGEEPIGEPMKKRKKK